MIAFLWLWLAMGCGGTGADAEDPPPPPVEHPAETVLDAPNYRFCHKAGSDAQDAMEWCPLLEGLPEERCPGLRETCSHLGDPAYGFSESAGCAGSSVMGERGADLLGAPVEPPAEWEPTSCDTDMDPPEGFGLLAKWGVAALIAVGLLVLFRLLWRHFGMGSVRRRPEVFVTEPETDLAEALPEVPDLPSGDLLSAARAALADGDVGRAVLLARGAALRGLGERGRLKLHRSRTDREYAQGVRQDASLYRDLRHVLDAVEVHRWGGRLLDRELGEVALKAASRILGLAVVLLAFSGAAHGQNRYGPFGDAALFELYEDWGYEASWRLRGLQSLDESTDALVLDLDFVAPTEEDWSALRAWVEAGGVLVAGGDASVGFPELGTWVGTDDEDEVWESSLAEPFSTLLPDPVYPGGPRMGWEGTEARSWIRSENPPVVVSFRLGEGAVIGIADPRLLWNGALVDPDNEIFLGDALYAAQSALGWPLPTPIRLQLATSAGASDPSPAEALSNAHLLPFVLHVLAFWALVALWKGVPFGPLRDPAQAGRLRFADHVAALGLRYRRVQGTRHAASAYARLWLARMGSSGLQLAAQRSGRDAEASRQFVASVEALAADPDGHNQSTDLDLVEELWSMTRT
jgi:hypothetical protein